MLKVFGLGEPHATLWRRWKRPLGPLPSGQVLFSINHEKPLTRLANIFKPLMAQGAAHHTWHTHHHQLLPHTLLLTQPLRPSVPCQSGHDQLWDTLNQRTGLSERAHIIVTKGFCMYKHLPPFWPQEDQGAHWPPFSFTDRGFAVCLQQLSLGPAIFSCVPGGQGQTP